MTRLHYICVLILIISSLLFLRTYLHQGTREVNDLTFARVVASVTDKVVPDFSSPATNTPQLVSGRGAITESRAILISVIVSVGLLVLVVFLLYQEKKNRGSRDLQVPLTAVSVALGLTYISMALKSGIL